jgi:hypothetical protein
MAANSNCRALPWVRSWAMWEFRRLPRQELDLTAITGVTTVRAPVGSTVRVDPPSRMYDQFVVELRSHVVHTGRKPVCSGRTP